MIWGRPYAVFSPLGTIRESLTEGCRSKTDWKEAQIEPPNGRCMQSSGCAFLRLWRFGKCKIS